MEWHQKIGLVFSGYFREKIKMCLTASRSLIWHWHISIINQSINQSINHLFESGKTAHRMK